MTDFDTKGNKRFRVSQNADNLVDELRALSTIKIQRDFSNYNDTLNHLQKTADHVASEAGMKEEPSVKKRLRRIEQLVSEGKQAVKLLEQRVVDAEEGYKTMRFTLLSEIKKEYINVPAMAADTKRAAVTPSDLGEVKRKRRTAASGAPKKKTRKKKVPGPRKAAAMAAKKAENAAKKLTTVIKSEFPS